MKNVMEAGTLKKVVEGEGAQQKDFFVAILKEEHLDQIMGLQKFILKNMSNPELMEPIPVAFMKEHVERRGFILGVFVTRRLIAYRIVYFPHSQDKVFNMGIDVGLAEDQLSKVANLQMVCVHPDFRGNALASKLNRHALGLLRKQHHCEHVFATVSPHNVWNVRILLNSGFCITTLKLKYGGKLRYIVYQKLQTPMTFIDDEVVYTLSDDLETQEKIFKSGRYGVAITQKQHLDGDLIKDRPLNNYIIFKSPADPLLVCGAKSSPHTVKKSTDIDFPYWCNEGPSAVRWQISGDPFVIVDSANPYEHQNQKGVSI